MFATLDLTGNMSFLDVNNLSTKPNDKTKYNHESFLRATTTRENKRLGISSRSRKGCKECKRKKKRCDEIKPICGRCLKANVPCNWSEHQQISQKQKTRQRQEESFQLQIDNLKQDVYFSNICTPNEKNPNLSPYTSIASPQGVDQFYTDLFYEELGLDNSSPIFTKNAMSSVELDENNSLYENCLSFHQELEQSDTENEKCSFLLESLKERVDNSNYNISFFEINLNKYPSQKLLEGLKDSEIVYLNYYRNCVSQTVSILPKESNFFLNLYLPLAEDNKSILYALIGWAGVFLNNDSDLNMPLNYIRKSVEISKQELKNKKSNKKDKLAIFSLYTILCAVLICAGDVKEWYKYFKALHKFLLEQSNGDLKEIKKCLGDFKETKWLISNFLYHDVLASISHINGTCFKMTEYCQILDVSISTEKDNPNLSEINQGTEYGENNVLVSKNLPEKIYRDDLSLEIIDTDLVCDPLQGCVRPLFMLIGEITNTFVELKSTEKALKNFEKSSHFNEFLKLRNKTYCEIEKKYENLQLQLKNTKPHARSLCYLKSDKDLELHLTLFEAYRLSASIYLKTLVKKIPPASHEIQILVVELLPCISIIIGSKVQASLCFPLLVAGMSCITECDRFFIEEKVSQMSSSFPVKNFQRILVIIKHTWQINKEGLDCVYWFDVSKKFGWDLSLA